MPGPVIIVGGGIVGISTAYYLTEFGIKVILLEQRNVASGASGRNGGMIMKIDGRDSDPEAILQRMPYVRENDILLSRLSEKFHDDFGIRRGGSLDIAVTDEEVETIRELVRMQREDTGDDEIQFLNAAELKRVSPFLSSNCLAARYRPSDGSLFPFQLIRALSFHIRERGAVIEQWTKVEEIISRDGNVEGVRTAKGVIESDCVVVAANGWTKYLLPDLPIMPLRSLAVLTEPMPPIPVFTFEAELKGKIDNMK